MIRALILTNHHRSGQHLYAALFSFGLDAKFVSQPADVTKIGHQFTPDIIIVEEDSAAPRAKTVLDFFQQLNQRALPVIVLAQPHLRTTLTEAGFEHIIDTPYHGSQVAELVQEIFQQNAHQLPQEVA